MGEGGNARIAMGFIMFTPVLSVICLWLCCYIILRDDLLPKDLINEDEDQLKGEDNDIKIIKE